MALKKLFLLLSTGLVLVGCFADTKEAPEGTETPVVEDVDGADANSSEEEQVSADILISIDGETLADLNKEITVPEGTYLLDVMEAEYDIVDEGAGFLSSINGNEHDMDAERYWLFYVNDEMASVGAADYEIEEGDVIEWKLEDSQF